MPSALADLHRLRPEGTHGLFASGGELFSDAVFGRDSAEVADGLAHLVPELARDVILSLAQLQGTIESPPGPHSNEEEVGKIHHEHRSLYVDGRQISARSQELLEQLSARWGGDREALTYYGAVDATPLFVRLVGRCCDLYGHAILETSVTRRDGSTTTVGGCVLAAIEWITRRMDQSPLGMVELLRRNPDGIPFQVWKDSGTSYLHLDGTIANWDAPIAAVEVQGYCYDALLAAARHLGATHADRADEWRERARGLRDRVIETMWMPREEYLAMGLDRDPEGRPRWIESAASNAALLLDTELFDALPDADRYVEPVGRRITGPEFLTEAGVRCRSLREARLTDFQDYHGVWAVWTKETFDVFRGLHRQGLARLAHAVAVRMLNAINVAGAHVEFLYVGEDGHPMYDYRGTDPPSDHPVEIAGTNYPEAPQAWTVSAALSIKWWLGAGRAPGPRSPQADSAARAAMDTRLAAAVPPLDLVRIAADREVAYARRGDYVLNPDLGLERDQAARARRAGTPR